MRSQFSASLASPLGLMDKASDCGFESHRGCSLAQSGSQQLGPSSMDFQSLFESRDSDFTRANSFEAKARGVAL